MPLSPLLPFSTVLPTGEHSIDDCEKLLDAFKLLEDKKKVRYAINIIRHFQGTHAVVAGNQVYKVITKEQPKPAPIVDPFEPVDEFDAQEVALTDVEFKRRGAPKGGWPKKVR